MTNKYQPRHARRTRGNEYTKEVWLYSFMLATLVGSIVMRYTPGLVALSWATSFVRLFAIIAVLTVAFAFIAAMTYLSLVNRVDRHNARALAEIRKARK